MDAKIQEFLDYLATEKNYSVNTIAAYRNDLSQFADWLIVEEGKGPVISWAKVKRDDIVSYILFMKEREYASSTVARKVAAVKSFFHHLKDEGLIRDDPSISLESPRVKKHLPKSISEEHMGLRIMRERAEEMGARLNVQSGPGQGTEISVTRTKDERAVQ